MPILKNRPPKYQRSGKYAVVYHNGKRNFIGIYGSEESKIAYSRFIAEIQANPTFQLTKGEAGVTVGGLSAAFLDNAKDTQRDTDYKNCCTVVFDFLLKLPCPSKIGQFCGQSPDASDSLVGFFLGIREQK
jgi:hypothetical protein